MRLRSDDGTVVDLRPVRFQFGPSPQPRDWDANWLYVDGQVDLADGRSWSFSDPCLTTWEARELGSWLKRVLAGSVQPTVYGAEMDEKLLVFTEPNLAFSLASRENGFATIRVHFSLESLPPWLRRSTNAEQVDIFDFFVEMQLARSALAEASASWGQEVLAFPTR